MICGCSPWVVPPDTCSLLQEPCPPPPPAPGTDGRPQWLAKSCQHRPWLRSPLTWEPSPTCGGTWGGEGGEGEAGIRWHSLAGRGSRIPW